MQNSVENLARSLEELTAFAEREQLEAPEIYRTLAERVVPLLNEQGGLVELQDLPTIVIPDLHARRELLIAILAARLPEGAYADRQVFELLQQGLINVLCVGDIVHSENSTHWVINRDGETIPELLDKEMVRSLGAGAMIMALKLQFPAHFYCLRGNHDDMAEEQGPFTKYVGVKRDEAGELVFVDGKPVLTGPKGESALVKEWVLNREGWGQEFLDTWSSFERALPLFATASYYVISHTLPKQPLTPTNLRARTREATIELTRSRGTERAAIEGTLEQLGLKERVQRWFYGHTSVPKTVNNGKYEEDLAGLLVRLNNPPQHVFAYIPASQEERRFDPTRDVYIKSPDESQFHL